MAVEDPDSVTTKLLTLLNVSATKVGKRKQPVDDVLAQPGEKLNKRRAISFDDRSKSPDEQEHAGDEDDQLSVDEEAADEAEEEEEGADEESSGTPLPISVSAPSDTVVDNVEDPYELHFGAKTTLPTEAARNAVEQKTWATYRDRHGRLGPIITSYPDVDGATKPSSGSKIAVSTTAMHLCSSPSCQCVH